MNDHANPCAPIFPLPDATAKTQQQWHSYCAALLMEIERLRGDNNELREQRRALAQMVPIPEDVQKLAGKSFEELMAMCDSQTSMAELIEEIGNLEGS